MENFIKIYLKTNADENAIVTITKTKPDVTDAAAQTLANALKSGGYGTEAGEFTSVTKISAVTRDTQEYNIA